MRNIEFYTKIELEKLIEKLNQDSKELQAKFNHVFDDTNKFISFADWNMDELVATKHVIKVLERVLERLNGEKEFKNTFKEFVLHNLTNVNYIQIKDDKFQLVEVEIWKEIYNLSPYVKEEWR